MKRYLQLWPLLFFICIAQMKMSAQLRNLEPVPTDVRAAFTVFDGKKINVYSSKPDGSDRKLIISEETELPNARAFDAIRATISPAGDLIAYMIPARNGWSPVYVIGNDGQSKRKVLDKAIDFHWMPDGKNILYSLFSPRPRVGGISFWAGGNDWYLLDLETGKSERVASAGDKFHYLASWVDNTVAIFGSSSLISSWLFEYDLKTKKKIKSTEVTAGITTNGSRTRRVGIVSPPDARMQPSCNIYEFTPRLRPKRRLVSSKYHQCENIMWNGDDEILYNKSTGPKGRINIYETSESGYYILLSIYKYDFQRRKEVAVIRSSGKEVYRLEGILDKRAIIVSNESVARKPRYILEARDLNGKKLHDFFTSEKEMWFVGWLR